MQTLVGIFAVALASQLVAPFLALLNVLISFCCNRMMVSSLARRERLDKIFSNATAKYWHWSQRRDFEPGYRPADGLHCAILKGGILLGLKSSIRSEHRGTEHFYELFIFGHTLFDWLDVELRGNANTINVRSCRQPNIFRFESYCTPYTITHVPYAWQSEFLKTALEAFQKNHRFSALLWGKPGLGKSHIPYLLNRELGRAFNCQPETIKANPTTRGTILSDLFVHPTEDRPVILLWNEYKAIVDHAESDVEGKSDGISMACNRTALLDTLDDINQAPNLIFIATMNACPSDMAEEYCRPGRFDLIVPVM